MCLWLKKSTVTPSMREKLKLFETQDCESLLIELNHFQHASVLIIVDSCAESLFAKFWSQLTRKIDNLSSKTNRKEILLKVLWIFLHILNPIYFSSSNFLPKKHRPIKILINNPQNSLMKLKRVSSTELKSSTCQ